jgi:Tol biopolymer transport system component
MTSGASFSPDGHYLAFWAQTDGHDALYLYDLQRKRVTRKLKFALDGIEAPSFSPDGQKIVFSGNAGGLSDLYITDLDGRLTQLTADRHADLVPSWSPDGKTIAFTTDRGPGTDFQTLKYGNLRVALYDLATRELSILPFQEQGKNLNPVWAPDASSLVWVNDAAGTNNLHLFDLEKGQLFRISDLLSGVIAIKDVSPVLSWSRSGKLLFTYFEKAGYNVYALADPRQLPRQPLTAATAQAEAAKPAPGGVPAASLWPAAPGVSLPLASGSNETNGSDHGASTSGSVTSFYRNGQKFRASEKTPNSAFRPVSITALLDSATLALPDTNTFKHRDYKVKFTPDIVGRPSIGAQVGGFYGAGLNGGSYIALSDILGNHNILMSGQVNGSLSDGNFFGAYSFLKRRANIGLMVEQLPLYYYYGNNFVQLDVGGQPEEAVANVYVRDVIRTAAAFVSYPFNTFRRLEFGASGVFYQSDMLYVGQFTRTGEALFHSERIDNLSYIQPAAALVFDNSLFGWTGPIMGRRYRAQVSHAFGSFQFTEGLLDLRNYWNYKRRVVLATRLTGLARLGADASRFSTFWGGPYYVRGYDASSFDLAGDECVRSRASSQSAIGPCPVRDQLIGSSVAFLNTELRIPLIKELRLGLMGGFPPVDFVTFFDAGVAWDSQICLQSLAANPRRCAADQSRNVSLKWKRGPADDPYFVREPIFSYGVGLRFNIFYTVLRLDYAIPLSRPDRRGLGGGVFSISLGPSF